jgi:sugar (pentulose or hexulose) kinase
MFLIDRWIDRVRASSELRSEPLGSAAALGADPIGLMSPPPIAGTAEPNPALVARYAEAYARYRALYPATRDIMHA